jgi:HNH endonuclease
MIAEAMLGSVLAAGAAGLGYVAVVHKREQLARQREQEELIAGFRASLVDRLRTKGASKGFVFLEHAQACGVEDSDARAVADDLFQKLCAKVFDDGVVTDAERKQLLALTKFLDIDSSHADRIESEARSEVYRQAAREALADGVVTSAEARALATLRATLGIDRAEAIGATEALSRNAYVDAVRRIVETGVVMPSARADLERLKGALLIRDADARVYLRDEATKLYRELFTLAAQDGEITAEEEESLDWLQREAGIGESDVRAAKERIAQIRRLAEYRLGRLPIVQTRMILESGDHCHWVGNCEYFYSTPSGKGRQVSGTLALTSRKVILNSEGKPLSFSPSRVLDIRRGSGGIQLDIEGRSGSGTYCVRQPEELEAVLTGLVRKHKYLAVEHYSSAATRHIPREVKVEVWHRDGGRCVQCSAVEYLEFDHVIPHSRGGANTVANVQILCRKCNGEKSDRI